MNGRQASIAGVLTILVLSVVFLFSRTCESTSSRQSQVVLPSSNRPLNAGKSTEPLKKEVEIEVQGLRGATSKEDVEEVCKKQNLTYQGMLRLGSGSFFRELLDDWFYNNEIDTAIDLVEGLPDPKLRYLALTINNIQFRYSEAPESFLDAASSLSSSEGLQLREKIFLQLGKEEPEKGMALLDEMGQGLIKEQCVSGLFRNWAKEDRAASLKAAKSLVFPEDRKTALASVRSVSTDKKN